MDECIFTRTHRPFSLYVNDRTNPHDEKKNRLLFEIRRLGDGDKSLDHVVYFMEQEDALFLSYLAERNGLAKKPFEKTKGLNNRARSIKITADEKGDVLIKIDNGTGPSTETGFTSFKSRSGSLTFTLVWEDMVKLALCIKQRLLVRNITWALCDGNDMGITIPIGPNLGIQTRVVDIDEEE